MSAVPEPVQPGASSSNRVDRVSVSTSSGSLRLRVLETRLAICRLDPEAAVPPLAREVPFFSITRTTGELSIICPEECVSDGAISEKGWQALEVVGPLDFSLVGILVSVAAPLAEAGVSIFAVSTYDTDYVLVKEEQLDLAVDALRGRGYEVL